MPAVKNRAHGVIQRTRQFDGNYATYRYAVSVKMAVRQQIFTSFLSHSSNLRHSRDFA